ncbi:MAG: gluconokinase [Hyphomicrobiaceae bacterium]|nr:gluconokinase [Hyphomicrobiaceae bacterium]
MGVSGCGKTTVGAELARALGVPFLDGDDYHPPENKRKMAASIPLTDDERWPWLAALAAAMHESSNETGACVSACSALKRSYRDFLRQHLDGQVTFVFLAGDKQTILDRMAHRHHEYMPASLLDSQYQTLEPPAADEPSVTQFIKDPVETIVQNVVSSLTQST